MNNLDQGLLVIDGDFLAFLASSAVVERYITVTDNAR